MLHCRIWRVCRSLSPHRVRVSSRGVGSQEMRVCRYPRGEMCYREEKIRESLSRNSTQKGYEGTVQTERFNDLYAMIYGFRNVTFIMQKSKRTAVRRTQKSHCLD